MKKKNPSIGGWSRLQGSFQTQDNNIIHQLPRIFRIYYWVGGDWEVIKKHHMRLVPSLLPYSKLLNEIQGIKTPTAPCSIPSNLHSNANKQIS